MRLNFIMQLLSSWAWIALLWAGGGMAWGDGTGTVVVGMEDFIGGTGETAGQVVREDLNASGVLRMKDGTVAAGEGWTLRGSSSAGRIDGALLDGKGAVVFNNHYADPDLRDNAHAFADDVVTAITGGRGMAGTKLAFVSGRSGAPEIYLADSDGQRVRQVTTDRVLKGAPALAPGSILLAFTSWQSGFADVVLKDLRFGTERTVLNAPGTNSGVAFSHDGTRLALSMSYEGNTEIYVSTLTGSRVKRVTEARSVEFSPAWSPDGTRLVFCSDAGGTPQLFVVPRKGGEPERLETGYRHNTSPEWSPDGSRIAFTGRQNSGAAVMLFDLAAGKSRVLLPRAEDPTWAPDGRHLAAVLDGALVVVDTVTGSSRTIVSGFAGLSEPAWSR
jgi:TolB protein